MLLAASGASGGGSTPTDPPDIPVPLYGWPETTDETLMALRPLGTRVLATRTATPGDYLGDHVEALKDEVEFKAETPYGALGPEHFAVLFLPAGEYEGGFGSDGWLSIVGMTGNPEDVVIFSDTIRADGVFHPFGATYVEGVTFKAGYNATLQQNPKYPAHIGASPMCTFANVILDATETNTGPPGDSSWGGGGPIGLDGASGMEVVFYRTAFLDCVLLPDRVGSRIHAGPPGPLPANVSFIECTVPKGFSYAGQAHETGARDNVYVVDGDIGRLIEGPDCHVYTNLDNTIPDTALSVTRNHTDWPKPTQRGLVQKWNDYYYPSSLEVRTTVTMQADVDDVAPMTPVAGRIYYCPIPVTSAVHLSRWGIHVRTGAGKSWGWRIAPDPGSGTSAKPADMPNLPAPTVDQTLANGRMFAGYFTSHIIYPANGLGGNRAWFAFKIPDTTGVTVDGSAELPGLHSCYYSDDNGSTKVKATAGTPFPLAHAAQIY